MILVNSDVFLIVDGRGAVAYGTGMKPDFLLLMTDRQRTDALGCVTPWSRRACWGSSTCSGWSAASSLRIYPSISSPGGPRRVGSARSPAWSGRCRLRTGNGCSSATPCEPTESPSLMGSRRG